MIKRSSSSTVYAWVKKNQGKHFCHCGCKGEIEILRSHHNKGIPKYIKGHGSKTDGFRSNLSEMRKGDKNPFYGMHHTEEELSKRPSFEGVDNPNYGKSHTDAAKRVIGDASIERWTDLDYRKKMLEVLSSAKLIRRNTSIEIKMQGILRQHGYFFQTHIPVCSICIPDIVLPECKIIIQCDGDYWHNYPDGLEKDRNQDKILTENGWRVIRFWEHEIHENIQDCLRKFEAIYYDIEFVPCYRQGTLDDWM